VYGYLIPANYFFLNELKQLPQTTEIATLVRDISQGIQNFGTVDGKLAYEVDGLGNHLLIDDANTPSLLSLSYLGVIERDNSIYVKTREFVLSESNPYFFSGLIASGIGSQHTPKDHIWPIAIAMEAHRKVTLPSSINISCCSKVLITGPALCTNLSIWMILQYSREIGFRGQMPHT
jgi:meiotically up-regulated gene 157 (Mug157) protein